MDVIKCTQQQSMHCASALISMTLCTQIYNVLEGKKGYEGEERQKVDLKKDKNKLLW
jgi:hypothetical protein